jgi:oxalate decarboxylase/phosphoglucose isomerase-like protein (cupin superfamily)
MRSDDMNDHDLKPYEARLAETAPPAPWSLATTYEQWRDSRGIPVHEDFFVADLTKVETAHLPDLGVEAAFIELEGAGDTTGSMVLHLGRNEATTARRHLYEEVVYVAEGEGVTEVETGGTVVSCRWSTGAVFSVPLNRTYRHLATSAGAVLYCVNTSPPVMNLFHNTEFIDDNPFEFSDRFDGREGYFSTLGRMWHVPEGLFSWETNLVEDTVNMELPPLPDRGAGGHNMTFQLGDNTLIAHVSEFPVGTYKKAHYHGPSAHVILLAGSGYSLLWDKSFDDRVRVDWHRHSVFVPPNMWWHQHFNTGASPARYLAIRYGSSKHRFDHSHDGVTTDRRAGGSQLEYDEQDPRVHELFREECRANGVSVDEARIFGTTRVDSDSSRR